MTWREPRRILELARVAVAPRDGYPEAGPEFLREHLPDLADRATFLDGPRLRLSASELRERAAAGRSLRYLVPDAVAAYIGDHGSVPELTEELRYRDRTRPPRRSCDRAARRRSAQARHRGAGSRAPTARARTADRRAGRGQEGRRHRPARPRRPDHDGRLLHHLLRRFGAAAGGHRERDHRQPARREDAGRSDARGRPRRTGSWSTSARSSCTSSRRPSATTTASRSTGPKQGPSSASNSAARDRRCPRWSLRFSLTHLEVRSLGCSAAALASTIRRRAGSRTLGVLVNGLVHAE